MTHSGLVKSIFTSIANALTETFESCQTVEAKRAVEGLGKIKRGNRRHLGYQKATTKNTGIKIKESKIFE